MVWIQAEDERLAHLMEAQYSSGKTAEIMGKTRNAVIGRAHRLGLNFSGSRSTTHSLVRPGTPRRDPVAVPVLESGGAGKRIAPVIFSDIHGLNADSCRWPMWADDERPRTHSPYCGCATGGLRYCPYHTRKSRQGRLVDEEVAS